MRAKPDNKIVVAEKEYKNQNKNLAKMATPSARTAKTLASYKSEKDLNKVGRNQARLQGGPSDEVQAEGGQSSMRKSIKIMKDSLKEDIRAFNSPKMVNEVNSPKSQAQRFLRSKNSLPEKQDDSIQKTLQQKNEKLQQLLNRNQQLETRVEILTKQKEKTDQILQQIRTEKDNLEKNVEKLKSVAQENRKLLKERAQGFNSNGNQIKALRAQLEELSLQKRNKSGCDIGINTDEKQKVSLMDNQSGISVAHTAEHLNPQANSSTQMKTPEISYAYGFSSVVNRVNFEQDEKLSMIAGMFRKFIGEQDRIIQERERTIYELQKQLNQLYEQRQCRSLPKPCLDSNEALLVQAKQIQELREALSRKEKECLLVREELWAKEREVSNLGREAQVKEILYKADASMRSRWAESRGPSEEEENLRRQVEQLRRCLHEEKQRAEELQGRNKQQQQIIKCLGKKTKIVK